MTLPHKPASLKYFAVVFALIGGAGQAGAAMPCSGIDRQLTAAQKSVLAQAVARQLGSPNVTILESFRLEGWRILYVGRRDADDAFLFYAHDPTAAHYVTLWAGAAMPDEGPSIRTWVLENAPGIPPQLAGCFAWHVTQHRDQ